MRVLTIRSGQWWLTDDGSLLHGYGDPDREKRCEGALRIDLRLLSDGEQRQAMIRLPVVDTRLADGYAWSHGRGSFQVDGDEPLDWLGACAPDVFARRAERLGAVVTWPEAVTA